PSAAVAHDRATLRVRCPRGPPHRSEGGRVQARLVTRESPQKKRALRARLVEFLEAWRTFLAQLRRVIPLAANPTRGLSACRLAHLRQKRVQRRVGFVVEIRGPSIER